MRPSIHALAALATLALPASAQFHRYDFDRRVELACDTTRIAVFDEARTALELRGAVADPGLDADALAAWSIPGWWLVPTRPAARTPSGVRELVRRLSADRRTTFASPVLIAEDGEVMIPGRDLFLGLADPDDGEYVARALAREGAVERDYAGFRGLVRVRTSARNGFDVLERANELVLSPELAFADVDFAYTGVGDHLPNDLGFPDTWGLHANGLNATFDVDVDGPEAWDLTIGSPSIRIAILDVGVDTAHADLRVAPGADVTSAGPGAGGPVSVCDNHGTIVAGAAAARSDNYFGQAVGAAPGCTIVPIRMLVGSQLCDTTFTTTTAWVVAGLGAAQSLGCRVTNCSNGLQSQPTVSAAYAQMHAAGIVHCASSGNSSATTIHYPASLDVVNGVGALAPSGTLATFSNTGASLDMVAPGVGIFTTDRTGAAGFTPNTYDFFSGTSLASPYVAGIAALVLSRNPSLSATQVDTILRGTCRDLGPAGYDTAYGYGLVRARAALDAAGTACIAAWTECSTSPNSVGPGALLATSGSSSVAGNDFVLSVGGCPPTTSGRFFFQADTYIAPSLYGNGIRCVSAPSTRFPNLVTSSSGTATQVVDWAHLPGGLATTAGQTWHFQFVYRNPHAGGAGFNISDAVGITLCP